jgi:hypothetical protein
MNHIDHINEHQTTSVIFDHIDRIINASRIEEMQELKKLVTFIDHLIQSIIHQIASGLLSDKGAKIKILHCFGLIQHCQIGNHPTIKSQVDKLIRVFEKTYNHHLANDRIRLQPKPLVLSSADIHHYVESIKDSMSDPIYSEKPKSLIDIVNEPVPRAPDEIKQPANNKSLSTHYLSSLFSNPKNRGKMMLLADKVTPSKEKNQRIATFESMKKRTPLGNITATI